MIFENIDEDNDADQRQTKHRSGTRRLDEVRYPDRCTGKQQAWPNSPPDPHAM